MSMTKEDWQALKPYVDAGAEGKRKCSIRGRPFPIKHGHASWLKPSKTYMAWSRMIRRCRSHPHYLKLGITVCSEWSRFECFLKDMGECMDGLTLDRIDNNLGYSKHNCRWATRIEQMNNQSKNIIMTAFGETKTIAMWARDPRCKTGYAGLRKRFIKGVKPEIAITTPNRKPCGKEVVS